MKKNILMLCVGCILCMVQTAGVMAASTKENFSFSDPLTLRTWVANDYRKDKGLMRDIKNFIERTTWTHGNIDAIVKVVPQDQGAKRDYGKTFPTLEALELPFLQHVKKESKNKKIITLEIAAAKGFVSWKVPLAFGNNGMHYVNDLSSRVLEEFKINVLDTFEGLDKPNLMEFIKIVPGSCFNILEQHPELANNVNVIYVQNLEHFFNPVQDKKFLALIESLLAPGGYAFLCAQSPDHIVFSDQTNMYRKLFLEAKANGSIYPAFLQYDTDFIQTSKNVILHKNKYFNIKRPENDEVNCSKETLKHEEKGGYNYVTQRLVDNYYTPEIYRLAIANSTKLKVVDAFYMDNQGRRLDNQNWDDKNLFAAVIVRKNASSLMNYYGAPISNFGEDEDDTKDFARINENYKLSEQMGVYHGHGTLISSESFLPSRLIDNVATDNDMISAFTKAAKYGELDKLKTLLKNGAEIDKVDATGFTALMYASMKGYTEIVKILLAKNADPSKTISRALLKLKEEGPSLMLEDVSAIGLAKMFKQRECLRELMIANLKNDGVSAYDIMNNEIYKNTINETLDEMTPSNSENFWKKLSRGK